MRILVSAYSCSPGAGSEPGTGWNWALQAAHRHDVWVITHSLNRARIEASPEPMARRIHWIYYDVLRQPKTQLGGRLFEFADYSLWQLGVVRRARELGRFDVVHHATFAGYAAPTHIVDLGFPMVWGPLGGAEVLPLAYFRGLEAHEKKTEVVRALLHQVSTRRSWFRRSVSRCAQLLLTSDGVVPTHRLRRSPHAQVFGPPVGLSDRDAEELAKCGWTGPRSETVRFVSVGRFFSWKGFQWGIRAFAEVARRYPRSEYWIAGYGGEEKRLRRVAEAVGVGTRVRFMGSIDRRQLFELLRESSVLVHPSVHDAGAWIIVEAMAAGLPVLCHEKSGPAFLVGDAGSCIRLESPEWTVQALARRMAEFCEDPALCQKEGERLRRRALENFTWRRQGERMDAVYQKAAT